MIKIPIFFGIIGCVALPWHFEFYILKCKIFLINFLDELGNFKQKNFTLQNVNFLHFTTTYPFTILKFFAWGVLIYHFLKTPKFGRLRHTCDRIYMYDVKRIYLWTSCLVMGLALKVQARAYLWLGPFFRCWAPGWA